MLDLAVRLLRPDSIPLEAKSILFTGRDYLVVVSDEEAQRNRKRSVGGTVVLFLLADRSYRSPTDMIVRKRFAATAAATVAATAKRDQPARYMGRHKKEKRTHSNDYSRSITIPIR